MGYTPPDKIAKQILLHVYNETGKKLNYEIKDSQSIYSGGTYILLKSVDLLEWDEIKYVRQVCKHYDWEITNNTDNSVRIEKS